MPDSITKAKNKLASSSLFSCQYKPWEKKHLTKISQDRNQGDPLPLIITDWFSDTWSLVSGSNAWLNENYCQWPEKVWAGWHASGEQVASKASTVLCVYVSLSVQLPRGSGWGEADWGRCLYCVSITGVQSSAMQAQGSWQPTLLLFPKMPFERQWRSYFPLSWLFHIAAFLSKPHITSTISLSALFNTRMSQFSCRTSCLQPRNRAIKAAPYPCESFRSFRSVSMFTIFIMFLLLMLKAMRG